jgi:hypothetical protein
MRKSVLVPVLLSMLLGLSACQREETKEYVTINGKVFIFNIRLARAYYVLTLNRLEAAPDNGVVKVEFENPAGGPALVSQQKIFPNMKRIDLQSGDLNCVVADKPYAIHITVNSPEGKVLQTLDTTLESTLDQTIMPANSLVLGAAYDKNPEAFGKDGKIKFREKCPAK